jgi:NAD dependent epimerase/dehydratase family enzyme
MLALLRLPFRFGLGARLGPGTQFISWISLTDYVRALRHLLDHAGIDGPVNLTAPGPVTNAVLTAEVATALRRPAVLRIPAPVLHALLGEVSSELLGSQRVLPRRLLDEPGFAFRHPDIASALAAEL